MRTRQRVAQVSAILAAATLALAGCGSSSNSSGTSSPEESPGGQTTASAAAGSDAAATGGTINVWTWTGAPGTDSMTALAAGFEKENPGVKVNWQEIARDDFKSKVPLALNAGEVIDVLGVQPNQFATDIEDQLQPVADWEQFLPAGTVDSYTTQAIDQTKKLYTDGEIRSLPIGLSGSVVGYYNADILKELGLQPPQTWDDMQVLADTLKQKMPDVAPAVMPGDGWFQDEFVLTMAGQTNPEFFDKVRYDSGAWNTPEYVAALEQYQKLYETGALDKDLLDLDYTGAMEQFYTGKAAIVFNGSWEAGMLKDSFRAENKITATDIGAMAVPAADPANQSLRSFLDITWGIPTTAANTELAAKFIAYAGTGDGVATWADNLGFVPALKDWTLDPSVLTTDVEKDGYAKIQELIANPHSDRNNLSAFSDVVGTDILEVLQGRMTAADAASNMQSNLDSGKFSS